MANKDDDGDGCLGFLLMCVIVGAIVYILLKTVGQL